MENGNNINYTHHVFKLIKQFDINLYQHLLGYFKKYDRNILSKYLFGPYKNKYEDPILEIVKDNGRWYRDDELNNVSDLSKNKTHIFLLATSIYHCGYSFNRLLKLNKIFWEDNILLQYTKEHNVK